MKLCTMEFLLHLSAARLLPKVWRPFNAIVKACSTVVSIVPCLTSTRRTSGRTQILDAFLHTLIRLVQTRDVTPRRTDYLCFYHSPFLANPITKNRPHFPTHFVVCVCQSFETKTVPIFCIASLHEAFMPFSAGIRCLGWKVCF